MSVERVANNEAVASVVGFASDKGVATVEVVALTMGPCGEGYFGPYACFLRIALSLPKFISFTK